jgi:hypothetical protein
MRLRSSLAAAVLGTAAAGPLSLGLAGPAASATCADAGGVSVVVDFKGLGGGVQSVCDVDGGGQKASALFTGNGHQLTYAQRTPGFVCRVDAKPASDPCINTSPANAYWGLWWSDGANGKWTYSTLGAGSLTIPDGGSVAFAWDGVEGSATPGVAPPKQAATPAPTPSSTPKPTPEPTPGPTRKPTPSPDPATPVPTPGETPTPSTTPTASESPTASASATPSPSASGTLTQAETTGDGTDTTPSDAPVVTETSAEAADPDDGLPTWVPIAVIALLFGGAAVVVRRRASAPGPTDG